MRLIVYGVPFPEGMAMTNRLNLYFKALRGKNIELFAFSVGNEAKKGNIDGVNYQIIQKKRMIQKHIDSYYLYAPIHAYNIWKIASKNDVILINRFGWVTLLFIIIVGRIKGNRIVIELNENPGSPGGSKLFPRWLRLIHRSLTLNFPFRLLDGFICISKPLEELAKKYKKRSAKTILIPILCELPSSYSSTLLRQSQDESPYIFHAGYFDQQKDGIYNIFEAFALACKQTSIPIRFVLTVRSAQKEVLRKIDKIIKMNKLEDRITWLGYVSHDLIRQYSSHATLGILNRPSNWQNDYNFPTKIGELLADGVPVIASDTGEMKRYLRNSENALLIEPNNVEQIADRIVFVLEHPKEAKRIGENGRKLAQAEFDYSLYSTRLHKFLMDVQNDKLVKTLN